MKHILVLGATSAIAQSLCRKLAPGGACFRLLGRHEERLDIVAGDLMARGASAVDVVVVAAGDFAGLRSAIKTGVCSHGPLDLFLAAQGLLPDQELCEQDPALVAEVFQVNTVDVMQATLVVAAEMESQGQGTCVVFGSVAGDRGRRGIYLYGAAKAALETFCDGLGQRLEPAVRILLVKPGPVDTPMTKHLSKGALFSTPDKVADDVLSALRTRVSVVYTPFYWRWIMLLIRFLPGPVVKRLRA